jgi:hypothetical protein
MRQDRLLSPAPSHASLHHRAWVHRPQTQPGATPTIVAEITRALSF